MKTYRASAYYKNPRNYTAPIPHPVWWRRLLGQTISYPIGWESRQFQFKAPSEVIDRDWFQSVLFAALTPVPTSGEEVFAYSAMLEELKTDSSYIRTTVGQDTAIEHARTNLLRKSS
jgi:hypothetical protein